MIKGTKAFYESELNPTGTSILATNVDRLGAIFRNLGPDTGFLYGNDPAVAFPLLAGESFDDDISWDLWSGITSGSTVLRVIEVTAV